MTSSVANDPRDDSVLSDPGPPPGPVTCGIGGVTLTPRERDRLAHPAIGGVILFKRNFENILQLSDLVADIRLARGGPLVVSVDHEGGRVQRFREGLTRLPAMRLLGHIYDEDANAACVLAGYLGALMALELGVLGVDHSYTPVLDLDYGASAIIGNRAFHHEPAVVAALAGALVAGLRTGGMAACGKHFPGHGAVRADSHEELPEDPRPWAALQRDLEPYRALIARPGPFAPGQGAPGPHAVEATRDVLAAVMPAHVRFPAVDAAPAGVSRHWLETVLRGELGFDGAIVTDDLGMRATASMGGPVAAGRAALDAGADVLLSCNDPTTTDAVLAMALEHPRAFEAAAVARRLRLRRQPDAADQALKGSPIAERRAAIASALMPWASLAERVEDATGALVAPAVGEA